MSLEPIPDVLVSANPPKLNASLDKLPKLLLSAYNLSMISHLLSKRMILGALVC